MIQIQIMSGGEQGSAAIIQGIDQLARDLQVKKSQLLLELANLQANRIVLGTQSGLDIYGRAFVPLATRVGQPLMDTGAMLGAVHAILVTNDAAAVGIGSPRENAKARFHQYGVGPIRPVRAKALHFKTRTMVSSLKTGKARTVKGDVFVRSTKGIPARPFFGWRPGDKEAMLDFARKSLAQFKKDHFGK
jgi:phage gpG-like protein